jgi:hypothetical protein
MTDSSFDRFTRLLAGPRSRRQTLAALGALAAARLQPAFAATQIEIPACGAAGAVCTPIAGCCSGLVCATSTVNPAYGVCVTGEGDMLPVTDDLVVPGSEGITEELAGQASEAAADASSAESILAAQEAEIQSRRTARDTRQAAQRTRLQSNRTTQQSRKTANRIDRRDRQDLVALNREPSLELLFILKEDGSELVHIENLDADAVVLQRVQSLADPEIFKDLGVTILEGKIYQVISGTTAAGAWTNDPVCPNGESQSEGVQLTVAQVGADKSHEIELHCGEEKVTGRAAADSSQSAKKHSKKGRSQKQAKRGKGK